MRRVSLILALACAWLCPLPMRAAPPPPFTARWDGPGRATVAFAIQSRACLAKEPASGPSVALACYDTPGSYRVTFGAHGGLDAAYRPAAGDVYVLVSTGETRRAQLRSVAGLAVVRR